MLPSARFLMPLAAMALSASIAAEPVNAAIKLFSLQVPLNAIDTADLSFPADFVQIGRNGTAFLAQRRVDPDKPGGSIALFDPEALQVVKSVNVPQDVEDLVVHPSFDFVYFVGNDGENAEVSRLDPQSGEISSALFKGQIVSPSMAVDPSGNVYVASAASNQIRVIYAKDFMARDKAVEAFKRIGETPSGIVYYSGTGNVRDLAVSGLGSVLFATDTRESRVSALELGGKQSELDQIGYSDAKGQPGVPLVMRARDVQLKSGESSSLVLADFQNERLIIADFNPNFQSLDIVSDISFKVAAKSGARHPQPDASGTLRSPLLIDTNADQTVILAGSISSDKLLLYGRNDYALEVIREFPLPSPPSALDVSDDGRLALVVSDDHKSISLLSEQSGNPDNVNDLTQSEDVRQLQRALTNLGFPIGAVDGIHGDRTSRALKKAIGTRKLGFSVDDYRKLTSDQMQQVIKLLESKG